MRLSKVSLALIAAGVGAGLATGYTHLDSLSVGAAHAATPHLAMVAPMAATVTTAGLPDFTALVERAGVVLQVGLHQAQRHVGGQVGQV